MSTYLKSVLSIMALLSALNLYMTYVIFSDVVEPVKTVTCTHVERGHCFGYVK